MEAEESGSMPEIKTNTSKEVELINPSTSVDENIGRADNFQLTEFVAKDGRGHDHQEAKTFRLSGFASCGTDRAGTCDALLPS